MTEEALEVPRYRFGLDFILPLRRGVRRFDARDITSPVHSGPGKVVSAVAAIPPPARPLSE